MPEDFEIKDIIQCYNEQTMEDYLDLLETDEKRQEAETSLNLANSYFTEL